MGSSKNKKSKKSNSKTDVCHYHLCRKEAKVYKCEYCGNYFCEDHVKPKPPGLPKFNASGYLANAYMEEWRKNEGHPCPPYFDVWKEEQKIKEERYRESLNNFLSSSKDYFDDTSSSYNSPSLTQHYDEESIDYDDDFSSIRPYLKHPEILPKPSKYNSNVTAIRYYFKKYIQPLDRIFNYETLYLVTFFLLFLILSYVVYINIDALNKTQLLIFNLGSLLLVIFTLFVMMYLFNLIRHLINGFYKLSDAYKLMVLILLSTGLVIFYTIVPSYVFGDFSFKEINYSYFNPFSDSISFDYEFSSEPSISELETNPKNASFKYVVRGNVGYISYTLYEGVDEYLSSLPRSISYYPGVDPEPTKKDFVNMYLNNEIQRQYLIGLVDNIASLTSNKDDQVRIAISLVQNIPYDWESYNDPNAQAKYPYEVLYKNRGVCEEKSLLLAFLLRELGFGVVLFEFDAENHMAVGIKCPMQYSYKNTGYCFVESTTPSIITDSEGEYIGAGKLTSYPNIIFVSDGLSFDSVYEEYKDAREWNSIKQISENSGGYVDSYHYNRWLYLVEKYGIEVSG